MTLKAMRIPLILLLAILLTAVAAHAQETAVLEGRVVEARTGLPLPGAHLRVAGTPWRLQAGPDGRFRLPGLAPGSYQLEVTHVGYRRRLAEITLGAHVSEALEVRLHPEPVALPDMTVQVAPLPAAGEYAGARVITRETLLREKPRDLAELLSREGLAEITSDGSPGGSRTVSLRGSAAGQVLVLLDGRPLNEAGGGAADLSRISPAEVQRVEVYPQAPASLGMQAIGGVINIITLQPGLREARIQAQASQYGERQGAITLGHGWGGWPVLGIFEHRESNGAYRYRVSPDDGIDLYTRSVGQTLTRAMADYRRDHLALKLDPPGPVQVGYRRTLLRRHNPDYLPVSLLEHDAGTDDDRQEFYLEAQGGEGGWRPELRLAAEGYGQQTWTDYGPQYPALNRRRNLRGEVYGAEAAWRWRQGWRNISLGAGSRWERLWSADLARGYAGRRHEFGYLQVQGDPFAAEGRALRTGLYSGVRADLYSGQQAFVHPRLGLEIVGGREVAWSLRGEAAGAYSLPTFNALFWQEDLQSRGNPDLKPERSLNRELAARISWRGWETGLTGFDREVWDLIYWQLDFDHKWKPLNLYRARISGLEASLAGRTGEGPWHAQATVTSRWMRAVNQTGQPNTDGQILPYRPLNTTTLSLRQNLKALDLDLSARWVSRRYTNDANTQWLSPYTVWDAGLTRTFDLDRGRTRVTLRAEVRNLFDRNYRLVEAAPLPLREFWVSAGLEKSLLSSLLTQP
ncbi:MAG: TonB-dependent receptor [Candidatus Zixiibacteriota bacterium]|nr:MAG: TonB-dependent receptor [candidate division Zixibacteria bacterium]